MTDHGRTTIDPASLSEEGRAALDVALRHLSEAERTAYWASVTKCFNAPYQEKEGRHAAGAPIQMTSLAGAAICAPLQDGGDLERVAP